MKFFIAFFSNDQRTAYYDDNVKSKQKRTKKDENEKITDFCKNWLYQEQRPFEEKKIRYKEQIVVQLIRDVNYR